MPGIRQAAQALLVLVAGAAALLPRPEAAIERLYGRALYPAMQAALTGASNRLPIAVFDVVLVCALAVLLWWWWRAISALWRRRLWAPSGRAAVATLTLAAGLYLWFLAAWGLNYARPPMDARLALPPGAPTAAEVETLLGEAVTAANAWYAHSRGDSFVPYRAEADVARALHAVEAGHGRPRPTVSGTPKPTVLAPYFRMAGVDGLTAPFALETLLNPDLTAPERPFVLAHEWAHLSGYAAEADANFMAWLVTQEPGASPRTAYSGWLFVVSEASRQVPAAARRASLAALGSGPRQDLADIAARTASRVDLVERVGWRVYDSYLRSQGVEEGVRSYSRVVELIVRARRQGATAPAVPQ
jgi:hypothetical protein